MKDRVGAVNNSGYIEVSIDGEVFSTDPDQADVSFISDSNAVCSYLAGHVDADDVKAAAEKTEHKLSIHERLRQAEMHIEEYEEENCKLRGENAQLKKDLLENHLHWERIAERNLAMSMEWKKAANTLRDAWESSNWCNVFSKMAKAIELVDGVALKSLKEEAAQQIKKVDDMLKK